jgi:type I restriction enzyme S subunit
VSWKTVALGDFCRVIAGQSPAGKYYNSNGDGLPFYQGKKDFGTVFINPPTVWTEEVTKEAMKDDILMSVRAPVGPVNISTERICIGRGLAAIRTSEKIDKSYLFNFLLSIEKDLVGSSGAVFNSINKSQIESISIPLPPLAIQQKIVAKLDSIFVEIDKATAAAETNAKNAEALFQSNLRQIFQNIDQDWRAAELASVCDVFADGDWIETKDQSENGIRLIQTGNIGFGKFKARDSKARYVSEETFKRLRCTEIQQGDILVSRLPDPVGRACVIPKLDVKSITAVDCTIIRSNKEVISAEFLNFFFRSPQYFEQVRLNITGATRQRISRSLLGKTQIPIPPLVTQQNIVLKLIVISNELEKSSKSYKDKVSELAALKHSILRQAFSGDFVKE